MIIAEQNTFISFYYWYANLLVLSMANISIKVKLAEVLSALKDSILPLVELIGDLFFFAVTYSLYLAFKFFSLALYLPQAGKEYELQRKKEKLQEEEGQQQLDQLSLFAQYQVTAAYYQQKKNMV